MVIQVIIGTSLVWVCVLLVLAYKLHKLSQYSMKVINELAELKSKHNEIIGEVRQISEELFDSESIDTVTKLPKRNIFEDRLIQAIIQYKRQKSLFAIISLNINNINTLANPGSLLQQKLLFEVANRLQMCIRQVDTASYFAEGYFHLLLPHLSRPETAIYVAQRIQDNLLPSFKIDSQDLQVDISMGIAVYPIDGDTGEALILNANRAMLLARKKGKNQYQFNQIELHDLGQRELSISQIIRSAELYDHLVVHYKPFYDVSSNKPIYIQTVPQLKHPTHGIIPFNDFSKLLENSGRMFDVYSWLLKVTLKQFITWHASGFTPGHLAIPVSLKQLENPHFISMLTDARSACGTNDIQIALELSDDQIPQNHAYLEKLFFALNGAGIEISVGVISLASFATQKINKIPLNYLKIDSRIVQNQSRQSKEDILFKIIELAKDERIIVMAEGVDNDIQKSRLQQLGCQMMEGKVFSSLMPANLDQNPNSSTNIDLTL